MIERFNIRSLFPASSPHKAQLESDARALGIPKKERILATGLGPRAYTPAVVIATENALYFAGKSADSPLRISWPEILKATWEDPWLEITTKSGETIKLHLDPCGAIPPVVRDRVTTSVLYREVITLDTGDTVTMIGRREPSDTGDFSNEITWLIEFSPDADQTDPVLRESAQRALNELRHTLGV